MSLSSVLKRPLQMGRDAAAEILRRLPVSSEVVGPPKDEDDNFDQFIARHSRWAEAARKKVVFPSEPVSIPAAEGVFGPTEPGFLEARTYAGEAGVIYDCPDARVFNRPHAILSPDDRLFTFASTWNSNERRSHFAFHQLRLGTLKHLAGRTLYFGGNSNVWHFYIDCLRQLVLLQQTGRSLGEFDHIIAKQPTTAVEELFYARLGFARKRLVTPDPDVVHKCDSLTFFATPSAQGRWQPPLLRRLVFDALGETPTAPARRRLYISRARASFRRILNESELGAWLEASGFEVLHLETMTPEEQISAFRSAEIVVGCHGAGLTQILFSSPGTAVIELRNLHFRPENGVAECYRVLSGLLDLPYYAVTATEVVNPADQHNSDLRFRLEDLQQAVHAAESRLPVAA